MLPAAAFADAAQPAQPLSAPLVALPDEPPLPAPPAESDPEPAGGTVAVRLNYDLGSFARANILRYATNDYNKLLDYTIAVYQGIDTQGVPTGLVATQSEQGLKGTGLGTRFARTLSFDVTPGIYYLAYDVHVAGGGNGEDRHIVVPFTVTPTNEDALGLYVSGIKLSVGVLNASPTYKGSSISLTDYNGETIDPVFLNLAVPGNPSQGYSGANFVVIASGESMPYYWNVTPLDTEYSPCESTVFWAGTPGESDTITALTASYMGSTTISPGSKRTIEFRVTQGAPFMVTTKSNKHFMPFTIHDLAMQQEPQDGYDVYTGKVPIDFSWIAGGEGSGFLKTVQGVSIDRNLPPAQTLSITVDVERLADVPYRADNGFMQDDMLLNVNNAEHLVLAPGESFNLMPIRVWQPQFGVTSNYFFEPDYHVELLGTEGTVNCTPVGTEGQEYWTLTGLQPGINVVRLTYDPIRLYNQAQDQSGQSGNVMTLRGDYALPSGWGGLFFGANEQRDTGIVVVEVIEGGKAANTASLATNIAHSEYDYLAFDRDKTDHATYTFTPTAAAGDITVRSHRPLHEGTGVAWGSAWVEVPCSEDGSYTVDVYDGRNVVEVSVSGSDYQAYHVIDGRAVGVTVTSSDPGWQPGDSFKVGDTAYVSFDGLKQPLPKVAGIYNPGYPDTVWVQYDSSSHYAVRSPGIQYTIKTQNRVSVPITRAGEIELTNGRIFSGYIGKPLGCHRLDPPNISVLPDFSGETHTGSVYCSLPVVVLSVVGDGSEPVDKGFLMSKIAQASALTNAEAYTPASWAALVEALGAARVVAESDDVTQEQVDAVYLSLVAAFNALAGRDDHVTYIRAPKGAEVSVSKPTGDRYYPYMTWPLHYDEGRSDNDYDAYAVYDLPAATGSMLWVEACVPGQTVKQIKTFVLYEYGTTVTVDPQPLDLWEPVESGYYNDGLYTNLGDSGTLDLAVGAAFYLDTYRVWQAVDENYATNMIPKPRYDFELVGDSVSIERTGAAGRERLKIEALKPGTSVIRVSYGPLVYTERADGQNTYRYNGIAERNTGTVVVTVPEGEGTSAPFDTGITLRNDFDTVYFDAAAGFGSFSFTPAAGTSVRVHDPLGVSAWGSGWTDYGAGNADGSFTVSLKEGRNIVELVNGSALQHYVIKAKAAEVSVANLTRPGELFGQGDTARVTVKGIESPIERLQGVYNPSGSTVRPHLRYENRGGEQVVSNNGGLLSTLTDTFSLDYVLTDTSCNVLTGQVYADASYGTGHYLGSHRDLPGASVGPSEGGGRPHSDSNWFGVMPVITLPVAAGTSPDGASLSVTCPAEAVAGEPFDVAVSLAGAEQAATLVVSLELSEGVEIAEGPAAVTGLAGFEVMDVYKRSGTRTVDVTLAAWHPGASLDAAAEVLRVSLVSADPGTASVTLAGGGLARYLDATTADVEVALPQGEDATVTVTVEEPQPSWLRFDFNRDGKETLADLAFAQLYYRASSESGGEPWATVAERGMDVNDDGVVNVADYVIVLNYLYHR
jgi:hypothetical protein